MFLKGIGNFEDDAAPAPVVPGTEVMVDFTSERNNVVLVPQPSIDPHDPLVSSHLCIYTASISKLENKEKGG